MPFDTTAGSGGNDKSGGAIAITNTENRPILLGEASVSLPSPSLCCYSLTMAMVVMMSILTSILCFLLFLFVYSPPSISFPISHCTHTLYPYQILTAALLHQEQYCVQWNSRSGGRICREEPCEHWRCQSGNAGSSSATHHGSSPGEGEHPPHADRQ
jgi:hypothetical protein